MTFKTFLSTLIAGALCLIVEHQAFALSLKDCPAAVIKTVNDNLDDDEKVISIKSVTEGDWTYFEVLTNKEGYMTVDPDGTLESIDLGTDIDDIPAGAKAAIKKLPGKLFDVFMELNDHGVAEYLVEKRVKGSSVLTKIFADGSVVK